MAKYGLAQVDLNLSAQLALAGLSATPERDIAALLRSGQPIEALTRERLADALIGKAEGVKLTASHRKVHAGYRKIRRKRSDAQVGRELVSTIKVLGYDKAIENASSAKGIGVKSLEAHVTLARKIEVWIESIRSSQPSRVNGLSDAELEVAYLYADLTKQQPEECIRPTLPALVRYMDLLEQRHADARGIFPTALK